MPPGPARAAARRHANEGRGGVRVFGRHSAAAVPSQAAAQDAPRHAQEEAAVFPGAQHSLSMPALRQDSQERDHEPGGAQAPLSQLAVARSDGTGP